MTEFYPEIEATENGHLKVSEIHSIYYEVCGNPTGKPVVYIHGGPGGGISPNDRRYFDPSAYRIVLFDQRGAGKSTPSACLQDNDTYSLVSDMEQLRMFLKIDKWMLFGGSWGSTLALAYAIKHPEMVTAMVLRGIFTLRKSEINWFYQTGASNLFPDIFEVYKNAIPESERNDFVSAYYKRLCGSDEQEKLKCARAWSKWECELSTLISNPVQIAKADEDHWALAFARIECHYFINNGFFEYDGYLLNNIHRIKDIPGVIVQGRYDVVCPATSAWELHKKWNASKLHMIADAGHSATEKGIRSKLVEKMIEKEETFVDISNKQLDKLPIEITALGHITRLSLSNNYLLDLPMELSSMSNLVYINLKSNKLTFIPECITKLPLLEVLDLSRNQITLFPEAPGNLLRLTAWSLSRNNLTTIPTYISQMNNLALFKIDRNPIVWPPADILDSKGDMSLWIKSLKSYLSNIISNEISESISSIDSLEIIQAIHDCITLKYSLESTFSKKLFNACLSILSSLETLFKSIKENNSLAYMQLCHATLHLTKCILESQPHVIVKKSLLQCIDCFKEFVAVDTADFRTARFQVLAYYSINYDLLIGIDQIQKDLVTDSKNIPNDDYIYQKGLEIISLLKKSPIDDSMFNINLMIDALEKWAIAQNEKALMNVCKIAINVGKIIKSNSHASQALTDLLHQYLKSIKQKIDTF